MWQPHLKELALTGSYLKECIPDLDKEASGSSKSPLASSALVSTNATLIAANRCFSILHTLLHNLIFISQHAIAIVLNQAFKPIVCSCNGAAETESCSAMGGVCHTLTDGYFSLRCFFFIDSDFEVHFD